MFKKTLRNAVVGTVAAGAMILPAATTVAPTLQLVKCKYPKSVSTATNLDVRPPVVRPREDFRTIVEVTAGNQTPNGTLTVTVSSPNGNVKRQRSADIGPDTTKTFNFNGFKLCRGQDSKTYTVVARFRGNCKFKGSSDTGFVTVTR